MRNNLRSVMDRRELAEPEKLPGYLYHKLAELTWRDEYLEDFYRGGGKPVGNALVTTPVRPFFRDPTRYDPRPGKWSKVENIESLSRLGYKSDVYDIANSNIGPSNYQKYDVLVGDNQNFVRFSNELPEETLQIRYTGSMHQSQLKSAYQNRLESLAERREVKIKPPRPGLLEEKPGENLADAIVVMGDEYTAQTYREAGFEGPVYNIHTSHPPGHAFDYRKRNYETARENFVWLGGLGPVLKGLDRVLEAFAELDDLQLTVCGPVDQAPKFVDLYEDELYHTDNIETVGWVDVRSRTFKSIIQKSAWHIYPSASEGSSGAVASTMWRGLSPIVTKEVFSEVGDWGVSLPNAKIETILQTVQECANRDPQKVESMAKSATERAHELYSRDRYSNEIDNILAEIFSNERLPLKH